MGRVSSARNSGNDMRSPNSVLRPQNRNSDLNKTLIFALASHAISAASASRPAQAGATVRTATMSAGTNR